MAARVAEHLKNQAFFHVLEHRPGGRVAVNFGIYGMEEALQIAFLFGKRGVLILEAIRQVQSANGLSTRGDGAHVYHIPQLADIAGPGVKFKGPLGVLSDFHAFAGGFQEVFGQRYDVFNSIPQGWHDDAELRHAMKEIHSKAAGGDGVFEPLVGGGDQPYFRLDRSGSGGPHGDRQ